jgi:hypothetical protein
MPQNNRDRASIKAATPSKTTSDSRDYTRNGPLIAVAYLKTLIMHLTMRGVLPFRLANFLIQHGGLSHV